MKLNLTVAPQTIFKLLFWFSVFLFAASILCGLVTIYINGDDYWIYTRIFDFNVKNNLPHAYKSLLLLIAALVIAWIAHERKLAGGAYLGRWKALGWIFLWMSIDEGVQIHQQLVAPLVVVALRTGTAAAANSKLAWLIPYGILTAIFAVAYLPFLRHLPAKIRKLVAAGGVVYVAGVAVIEVFEHLYAKAYGDGDFIYLVLSNAGEWFQMVGTTLFTYALLLFIAANVEDTTVRLKRADLP
jgi:hypothetical protein